MKTTRHRKVINALALFLLFTMAQVYIQVNFAGPNAKAKESAPLPAQTTGKLTTTGDKPILVNGTSLSSGGTILSGATIDVPDGVGATIDLGPLGQLDLAPNTKVVVEYSNGEVKVRLVQGCAILRTKKGTSGEIKTDQGDTASNDSKKDGVADVCFPPGGSAIVGQGAAAAAGAGAGAAAGGAGGLFGLGTLGTIGVVGGSIAATALIIEAAQDDNPSSSGQ